METKDNEEVRRMLNCVRVTANYALAELDIVHELLEEGMNLDAADMVVKVDEAFYKARRALFDARIEVDKLRKSLDKHVSHCLNPIAKTAPKSAKKGRGKVVVESKPYNDLDRIVEMNAIMPGKDGHHTAKKHTTISRGNAPKNNPAHDSDKPF